MPTFHTKKYFGDDHEIFYDSVSNHDVYKFLRIVLDVPRNQSDKAVIVLNGKEIGEVYVIKEGVKTVGYHGYRYQSGDSQVFFAKSVIKHRQLGKVVAAVISDYALA